MNSMESAGAGNQALAFSPHGIVWDLPLDERIGRIAKSALGRRSINGPPTNNKAPMAMSTITTREVASFMQIA
ncbi:MAG: hypothetical protein ACREX4_21155 [Gammaproteobacteria bacterium]